MPFTYELDPELVPVMAALRERAANSQAPARGDWKAVRQTATAGFKIMKQRFLDVNPTMVLVDPKREFDYFEKVVIFRRDKEICQNCGKKVEWKDFEADHVYPHSKGGTTTIENGQLLCGSCNSSKGATV